MFVDCNRLLGQKTVVFMLKNKLVRDASFTTISRYLTKFIALLRGFWVAKLLDPSLYGYFSGLSLVLLYNSQVHLGILHGLNRNLSLAKGAEQEAEYCDLVNNGVTAIVLLSLLFGGVILVSSFMEIAINNELKWGLRVYAALSVLFHFEYIIHSLLRVHHRFKEIMYSKLLFSFTNIVSVIILTYLFGFYGVLISFLISLILQNIYLSSVVKINFRFSIDFTVIKKMLIVGAPISFAYLIDVILNSADRLMIASFLSSRDLGFYGIALTFSSEMILLLPNTISYVVYPRILEQYGKFQNYPSLVGLFHSSTHVISVLVSVLIGVIYVVVEYFLAYLLPRYIESLPVVRVLVFSTYFISINQIAVRVLITTNKTKALIFFQMIAIIINIFLNYIMIINGYGIVGVSVATAISYFTYSILVTHFTLDKLYVRFVPSVKEQIKIYLPFFYLIILLVVVSKSEFFVNTIQYNYIEDFLSCTLKVLFIIVSFCPVVYFSMRHVKKSSLLG